MKLNKNFISNINLSGNRIDWIINFPPMDFLKDAIKSKKEEYNSLKKDKTKKWIKRGDIEVEQKKRYLEEQEKEKEEKERKKKKYETEIETDETKILKPKLLTKEEQILFEKSEKIKKKLRELKQPITMFGETDEEREERLAKYETDGIPELIKIESFEYPKIEEFVQKKKIFLFENSESFPAKLKKEKDSFYVHKIFNLILQHWENETKKASSTTREGKIFINRFKDTKRDISKFLNLLLEDSVPLNILTSCLKIVKYIQQKEYMKANDAYLALAIGNAPWPLGVTATGIHARSGRERIEKKNIKSIMNDDEQKQNLQAVKRLITYSQTIYPSDPSKMI